MQFLVAPWQVLIKIDRHGDYGVHSMMGIKCDLVIKWCYF